MWFLCFLFLNVSPLSSYRFFVPPPPTAGAATRFFSLSTVCFLGDPSSSPGSKREVLTWNGKCSSKRRRPPLVRGNLATLSTEIDAVDPEMVDGVLHLILFRLRGDFIFFLIMYVLVCIIVHMCDPLRDRTALIILSFNIRMYD